MGSLLQEDVRLVSTFDAQAVVNVAKKFDNAIDMKVIDKVSFYFAADSTYVATDADLTLQVYENATNSTSGGVALTGKVLTLAPPASGTAKKQGVVDVKASEMTSGKSFLYAEILGDSATQTAIVSGLAIAGDLRHGLGNVSAVTGTTFKS